jgi:hypothetical protein
MTTRPTIVLGERRLLAGLSGRAGVAGAPDRAAADVAKY